MRQTCGLQVSSQAAVLAQVHVVQKLLGMSQRSSWAQPVSYPLRSVSAETHTALPQVHTCSLLWPQSKGEASHRAGAVGFPAGAEQTVKTRFA